LPERSEAPEPKRTLVASQPFAIGARYVTGIRSDPRAAPFHDAILRLNPVCNFAPDAFGSFRKPVKTAGELPNLCFGIQAIERYPNAALRHFEEATCSNERLNRHNLPWCD
jgi:hypothetical protein